MDTTPSLSKATSRDSLEIVGVFNRNENPPVITLSSQEDDSQLMIEDEVKTVDQTSTTKELTKSKNEETTIKLDKKRPMTGKTKETQDTTAKFDKKQPTTGKTTKDNQGMTSLRKNWTKAAKAVEPKEKKKTTRVNKKRSTISALTYELLMDDEEDTAWLRANAKGTPAATPPKATVESSPVTPRQTKSRVPKIVSLF